MHSGERPSRRVPSWRRAATPKFSQLVDDAAIGCPDGHTNSDWVRTMAENRARKAGLGLRARRTWIWPSLATVVMIGLWVFSLAGSVAHARVSGSRPATANA